MSTILGPDGRPVLTTTTTTYHQGSASAFFERARETAQRMLGTPLNSKKIRLLQAASGCAHLYRDLTTVQGQHGEAQPALVGQVADSQVAAALRVVADLHKAHAYAMKQGDRASADLMTMRADVLELVARLGASGPPSSALDGSDEARALVLFSTLVKNLSGFIARGGPGAPQGVLDELVFLATEACALAVVKAHP